MTRIYRYVFHGRVSEYEALDWTDLGPMPGHHGRWSHLMLWAGIGEPVEPAVIPPARERGSLMPSP